MIPQWLGARPGSQGLRLKRARHSLTFTLTTFCRALREGGGVLLPVSEEALLRWPSWTHTGTLLELGVEERLGFFTPPPRAAQRLNVLPMAADLFGASSHLFSPFSVGLAARFAHASVLWGSTTDWEEDSCGVRNWAVAPRMSWASEMCFLDKHSTTEPHTASPQSPVDAEAGGEEWAAALQSESSAVIPKTWGWLRYQSSLKTGSLTSFCVEDGKDFNLRTEHHRCGERFNRRSMK